MLEALETESSVEEIVAVARRTPARQRELRWQPTRTSIEALTELIDGMRQGTDYATPPLARETSGPLRLQELRTRLGARP